MRIGRGWALRAVVAGLMMAMAGSMVALNAQQKKKHDAPAKDTTSSTSKTKSTTSSGKTDSKTPASTVVKPTVTKDSKAPSKTDSKSGK